MMHAPQSQLMSRQELDDLTLLYAREDFGMFRTQIRPKMIRGWWTQEVAWQLQRFYNEMMAGKRPKLAITAPPQHGKSWTVTDFIAYVAGRNPERKTIFGSYSDDLGIRTNLDLPCRLSAHLKSNFGLGGSPAGAVFYDYPSLHCRTSVCGLAQRAGRYQWPIGENNSQRPGSILLRFC